MVESTAENWPVRVQRLEQEVAGLRRAMRTRALIEQAKGILAERQGCDPETAYAQLSRRSQDTNTPLVDVAADVVNGIAPPDRPATAPIPAEPVTPPAAPPNPRRTEALSITPEPRPLTVMAGLAPTTPPPWPDAAKRRLRRAVAAFTAADDVTGLTSAVLANAGDPPPSGVAVFAAEPNGSLRLIGAEGWTSQQISEARRIPALIATPMSEVVRHAHPVLFDGQAETDLALVGPGPAMVGYPIAIESRVTGVLLISWAQPREFSALDRSYLDRLAQESGRAVGRVWAQAIAGTAASLTGDLGWIQRVIEGTSGMTQLLTPIRDAAGVVIDFYVAAMSSLAQADEPDALGRRLLDAYPQLLTNGVFDAYVRTLAEGTTWERAPEPEDARVAGRWQRVVKARRATPIAGAVIASWRRVDEVTRLEEQTSQMEQLGRFGWCEWDPIGKRMWWSPGMYRLLGVSPRRGPLSRTALVELAEPESRPILTEALRRAAHGGQATVDIDLRRGGEELVRLRAFAAGEGPRPEETDPRGTVRLLVQDISEQLQLDEQLRRTQAQASAQRVRLAAEHELTRALMDLLYPARSFDHSSGPLRVVGRHFATDRTAPLRGDFCDAQLLPNGDLLLVVGDMFGSGLTAASAVARLMPPVVALGIAGLAPEAILAVLNTELHRLPDPPLASLALARVDHETKIATWAQAGHLPPILVRRRTATATPLKSPEGPALGLLPEAVFSSNTAQLEPGDTLVFYTDGVLDRRARDPLKNLSNKLGRGVRAGEPESALTVPTPARTDEACLVALSYAES
ncbi:MAG: SpoIIE family protein phosphatase [Hamadaea sp.]|nr:SpoIIE family protein phosphatase [Hamadaea sp.]